MKQNKIIAVDFDGCLFTNKFPEIGEPIFEVINALKKEIADGARAILWTCRRDHWLDAALIACEQVDLTFDCVNDNLEETKSWMDGDSRKIFAHEYWDDRAVRMPHSGEVSDGYHTFNELYHHRAVLFATLCNLYPHRTWKSKLHHDGTMYDNMFICGIETDEGSATYHYDIEPYWNLFNVKILDNAPIWDGHTPEEAINRILTLSD